MTYVSGISLVGDQYDAVEGLGTHIAYVRDDQPTSPSYTPSAYQFNDTGASNTITRSGVGVYSVQFPVLSLGYGDVQVTAYGSGSEYCKVAYWMPGAGVQVRCFSSAGAPVDAGFDVTFLSSIWPRT
jgi:hypothetical protein